MEQYLYSKYIQILKWFFPKYYKTIRPFLYSKIYYKVNTGKSLNYFRPRTINEKLFWLTRYWQHPLKTQCADKYLVRDYVKQCKCDELLVPLYNVYENVSDITFENLPDQFVLKCNHGWGYNIICTDKYNFNIEKAKYMLNMWMNEDFGSKVFEIHYSKISRQIICEKYLTALDQKSLIDYKIHCINGKPYCFLICTDRDLQHHKVTLSSYSLTWERLNYLKNEADTNLPPPYCLEQMLNYAEILSEPFPYVRVDFYEVDGKVLLSELTFTPAAHVMNYYKDNILLKMGNLLSLPKKHR